ncbi:hypothetical protein D9619_000663 [Psilocybe cf. subviscida]|uniref:Yeast cell wall synthesis Kre9/Knh1-like N-terminal domain-containing protein n=1 Tax=Psilocybe cf. subviscida TaxID=2480587 RepID=A0A8H5BG08_9AGAR|nr:hypothetical protein D9619_000663 [Psilocybe cf. subviscida]
MHAVAVILAFVSCAFAYSVTSPSDAKGWTNSGSQLLTWQRVSTDPLNFTAVLDNQQITGFEPQILAALVDGTSGSQQMNPPSGGWPTGKNFRVNLVQDAQNLNAILAQSGFFSITPPTTSQSTSGTVNTLSNSNPTFVPQTTLPTASAPPATNTDPIVPPNSGASINTMNAFAIGALSLLGFALAA